MTKTHSFRSTLALCGLLASSLVATATLSAQKFEGLAQTPPMGWNSWNTFQTNISEDLVKGVVDAMKKNGMYDAGYRYIVLDDGWMTRDRDKAGNLIADPVKFPYGMKHLADYAHSQGFQFGLYNCAGTRTCADYPGSMGHEYQDALLYATFDIDYLKYDWCNTGSRNAQEAYATMRDALHAAGRPVVFSMCEWGTAKPWLWAQETGHLWRSTGDIYACYDCETRWSKGFKKIADFQATNEDLIKGAGPGHWNDPDMLEVGVGELTVPEDRSHFALWSVMAAPLIAGNDVRNMKPEVLEILINKEVIAVDQDKLGKQGYRYYQTPDYEIWLRELDGGDFAVCLINTSESEREVSVTWAYIGALPKNAAIRDLWAHKDLGTTNTVPTFKTKLAAHDCAMLRLVTTKPAAK
jgi:alpha-galactosidase